MDLIAITNNYNLLPRCCQIHMGGLLPLSRSAKKYYTNTVIGKVLK